MDVEVTQSDPMFCGSGKHTGMFEVQVNGSIYLELSELDAWQEDRISLGVQFESGKRKKVATRKPPARRNNTPATNPNPHQ